MSTKTKEPENKDEGEGPRSFGQFLAKLAEGEAERELSEQFHSLNKRCREEAKARWGSVKGELVLRIKLDWDENDVVGVAYKITKSEPPRKTSKSIFWSTKGGNLSPENPRQQKLALDVVVGGKSPKEAPAPAAAKEV